ncbi:hypothetical protein TrRE_jg7442, partial [Triparma retinervis]
MVANMLHQGVNIDQLEGWLEKEKQKKNKSLFGGSSHRRWFKVHSIPGTSSDNAELALCYYKHQHSKEPNGWLFLKDVSCVEEMKGGEIVLMHPVRQFNLTAPTRVEHTIWMAGLMGLCREAKIIREGEVITRLGANSNSRDGESKEDEEEQGWSKGGADNGYDEFRNGPKETEDSRKERAKKRAERRAERNKGKNTNAPVAAPREGGDHGADPSEDRDRRSDQYQHGNDATANTRITRAIKNSTNSNSEDDGEERKEEEEMMDDEEETGRQGYDDRERGAEPVSRSAEVAEEGKEGEQEEEGKEEEEEEGKEEEEEVKPKKKKAGPPPGKPRRRKEGKYKFGTGMNGSEEFEGRAEKEGGNNPPTSKLAKKDNGPEYDSEGERAKRLANDGGVRMEEMTLAEGERNTRRLSAGVAF